MSKTDKSIPVGLVPPKFLTPGKEHTYIPDNANEQLLTHVLKLILEKSGGSIALNLQELQESFEKIAAGQEQYSFRLWVPARIDATGQIVWTGTLQGQVLEDKTAALELVHLGPVQQPEPAGPVLVSPDGEIVQ